MASANTGKRSTNKRGAKKPVVDWQAADTLPDPEVFGTWRELFDADQLAFAQRTWDQHKCSDLRFSTKHLSCSVGSGTSSFGVTIDEVARKNKGWRAIEMYCTCTKATESRLGRSLRRSYSYDDYYYGPSYDRDYTPPVSEWYRCNHMAAALLFWEHALETIYGEGDEGAAFGRNQYLSESAESVPVSDAIALPETALGVILQFDVRSMLSEWTTNRFFANDLKRLRETSRTDVRIKRELEGRDLVGLRGSKRYYVGSWSYLANVRMHGEWFEVACGCPYPKDKNELCGHVLEVVEAMARETADLVMPDRTDEKALLLIELLRRRPEADEPITETPAATHESNKRRQLLLKPVVREKGGGTLDLSFVFGRTGAGRTLYPVEGLGRLIDCRRNCSTYHYGKNNYADFSRYDLTEESVFWLGLVEPACQEIERFNQEVDRLIKGGRHATIPNRFELQGELLDRLYDMMAPHQGEPGHEVLISLSGINHPTAPLVRGTHNLRVPMRIRESRPLGGPKGFTGLEVSMRIPPVYRGAHGAYGIAEPSGTVGDWTLYPIPERDLPALDALISVSGGREHTYFTVGLGHLQDLYRRVLPPLLEAGLLDVTDNAQELVAGMIAAEPDFVFRLDYRDGTIECAVEVTYGDISVGLDDRRNDFARDLTAEDDVTDALKRLDLHHDAKRACYVRTVSEAGLFDFQVRALDELRGLGRVEATDAFARRRVRAQPLMRLDVSIDCGLLDLTVASEDLSDQELLALLKSYRLKRRYHVLGDGSFVDLGNGEGMGELLTLIDEVGADLDEAVLGTSRLPLFRALYLDRLMEEREELDVRRNRGFRALVRDFQVARTSDYEVPASLEGTLRPYQEEGYRWLRVLEASGFGGILADEMGLGKTIQAIALMLALAERADPHPSLIVCPASLVYNWQEELERFAPALHVVVVAGPRDERQETIEGCAGLSARDVLITSYDLMRRDVVHWKDATLGLVVLDEAHYVKNPRTAQTKAVKAVHASMRLALTGTPVENRLTELWSIFDFLMPGFLYTHPKFQERYDIPITRDADEESTVRLRQLVSPFVMRRLKSDVLRDLPPKLEEVRYARLEGEQRRLYDAQVVHIRQQVLDMGQNGGDKLQVLAELTRIREICCDPSLVFEDYKQESSKRDLCLEVVKSAVEEEHRVLLFSQFTSMLALLAHDLDEAGIGYFQITGATPKEERVRLAHRFNDDGENAVFLVSLKAGGVGLNLTGADVVVHYDPWWNVAATDQATDRAHRIGQTRAVTVVRLVARDTIEERILELQERKRDLADSIVTGGGEGLASMTKDELLSLLED